LLVVITHFVFIAILPLCCFDCFLSRQIQSLSEFVVCANGGWELNLQRLAKLHQNSSSSGNDGGKIVVTFAIFSKFE
jgi:hypothetical protein